MYVTVKQTACNGNPFCKCQNRRRSVTNGRRWESKHYNTAMKWEATLMECKRKVWCLDFHWSTCAMSSDKAEQRGRRMETSPHHTLTVTESWPQLTPSVPQQPGVPFDRGGLNRVWGFFQQKNLCCRIFFLSLSGRRNSQTFGGSKTLVARQGFGSWHTELRTNDKLVFVAGLFAKRPSIHHLTFSFKAACWQKR